MLYGASIPNCRSCGCPVPASFGVSLKAADSCDWHPSLAETLRHLWICPLLLQLTTVSSVQGKVNEFDSQSPTRENPGVYREAQD